jgi:hypothetical protein
VGLPVEAGVMELVELIEGRGQLATDPRELANQGAVLGRVGAIPGVPDTPGHEQPD